MAEAPSAARGPADHRRLEDHRMYDYFVCPLACVWARAGVSGGRGAAALWGGAGGSQRPATHSHTLIHTRTHTDAAASALSRVRAWPRPHPAAAATRLSSLLWLRSNAGKIHVVLLWTVCTTFLLCLTPTVPCRGQSLGPGEGGPGCLAAPCHPGRGGGEGSAAPRRQSSAARVCRRRRRLSSTAAAAAAAPVPRWPTRTNGSKFWLHFLILFLIICISVSVFPASNVTLVSAR